MQMLQSGFEQIRASSSVRFVTSVAVGVRPFALGTISADDILRGAISAAQDARSTDRATCSHGRWRLSSLSAG
jgi:hypothetical protein